MSDEGALRHNQGKLRYDLIPPEFMEDLAAHLTRNCDKYPERNWERGLSWASVFASLMRHAWKWAAGENFDPDGGAHHMIAVAWNAMALAVYARRKIGLDDRKPIGHGACRAPR